MWGASAGKCSACAKDTFSLIMVLALNAKDATLDLFAPTAARRLRENALPARQERTRKMASAGSAIVATQGLSARSAEERHQESALLAEMASTRKMENVWSVVLAIQDSSAKVAAAIHQESASPAHPTILKRTVHAPSAAVVLLDLSAETAAWLPRKLCCLPEGSYEANGECTPCDKCSPGFERQNCGKDAQGTCIKCGFDSYEKNGKCVKATVCTIDEYEVSPSTPTQDRVCSAITTCSPKEYESVKPSLVSDRVCTSVTECIEGESMKYRHLPKQRTGVCSAHDVFLCGI